MTKYCRIILFKELKTSVPVLVNHLIDEVVCMSALTWKLNEFLDLFRHPNWRS